MNSLPSDPDEHIIDIFVLSGSSEGAPQLRESLSEAGYRVTLFSDRAELLESLQSGIPNLLICDATTGDGSAYEICRQLKADDNLWMIPVLLLTRTSGLTDLLNVLDCNADNFITWPSDSGFLLVQVDGMLNTPVERQTPEMVKTQFRIQHDEKVYLVTADRRKLLELLLSSFEIAVGFSAEIQQVRDETGQLSADLRQLRNAFADQNGKIARMNEVLQQKDQHVQKIARTLEERESDLEEKTGEIDRLLRSIDDDRALIASAEEHIRLMLAEKEETAGSHQAITISHQQRIASLTAEIETTSAALDQARSELAGKTALLSSTESRLTAVSAEKEDLERALSTLTGETERIKASLDDEKERADSLERELHSLTKEKDLSDQEMARKIQALTMQLGQNTEEISTLNVKLGEESARADSAEGELAGIRDTLGETERKYRADLDRWEEQRAGLQAEFASVTGKLDAVGHERMAAETAHADATREKEQLGRELAEQSAAQTELRTALAASDARLHALEEKLQSVSAERDRLEEICRNLSGEKEALDAHLREQSGAHAELKAALAASGSRLHTLEEDLATVSAERDRFEQGYRDISGELDQLQAALDEEKALSEEYGEKKSALIEEKERLEHALRTAREEAAKTTGALERELTAARAAHETLQEQHQALEAELAEARTVGSGMTENARRQQEALLRVQAELEAEQELRRSEAELHTSAAQTHETASVELRNAIHDRDHARESLKAAEEQIATLAREKEFLATGLKEISETTGQAEQGKSEKISRLEEELLLARQSQQDLEREVAGLRSERAREEEKLSALSMEIQQARAALADEWEDHMNADERLQLAQDNHVQLRQAEEKLTALNSELAQARAALADEWEDHMNAQEKLAAADEKNAELRKTLTGTGPVLRNKNPVRTLVVKDSSLPAPFAPRSSAVARVDMPPVHAERDAGEHLPVQEQMAGPVPEGAPRAPSPGVTAANVPLEDLFEEADMTPRSPGSRPEQAPCGPGAGDSLVTDDEAISPGDELPPRATGPSLKNAYGTGEPEKDKSPGGEELTPVSEELPGREDESDKTGETERTGESEGSDETGEMEGTGGSEGSDETGETGATGAAEEDENSFQPEPGSWPAGGLSFDRQQWLGLFSWARHAEGLTGDQKREIMRMGRLVQKGRRLTAKQDERIREMLALVHALGYRFS